MQWGKTIRWGLAIVGCIVIATVIGGYLLVRSNAFLRYATRKIEERANQATGARSEIGSIDLELSTLTIRFHDVVLHGMESASQLPLLRIDELTVGLKIVSVLQHKINLSELLIRHPVVHVEVNRQGQSNCPQPPSSSSSHTSIFDLAIGHFSVTDGEVNYRDQQIPINANLYHLQTLVTFLPIDERYSGTIGYSNGRILYAQYPPIEHSLKAEFFATPSRFSLKSALLSVGSSHVLLHADITDFSNLKANGSYDVLVHTQEFAPLLRGIKSVGDLRLSGDAGYQTRNGQSFLRSISVSGNLESGALSIAASDAAFRIQRLEGRYRLADGTLTAKAIKIDSLGGKITGDAEMRNLDTAPASHVRVAMNGISLRAMQAALHRSQVKEVALSGTLRGTADASWGGSLQTLRVRSDLAMRGSAQGIARNSNNVPVDADIHAMYDGPTESLLLRQSNLRLPSLNVTADGRVSKKSQLQIHAQAGDLHQLMALASSFRPATSTPAVSGSATLDATIQGAVQKPQLSGQLRAQDLEVQGSKWKSMALSFNASPSQITISNGSLISAGQGRAGFEARVALRDWAYSENNSIHANLSARQLSVSDLERLANLQYPLSGDLSVKIAFDGSEQNPAGNGTINVANGRAYGEELQKVALRFQAANSSVTSTLDLASAAGSAGATVSYTPRSQAYNVRLDAQSITLQTLHALHGRGNIKGTLSLSASGEGTLDDPQLRAVVQIPSLEVDQKSIAGLKAELLIANKRADINLESQVAQASVRGHAQVELSGDYQTDASIDTAEFPLGPLLTTFSTRVPEGFQGQTEIHATLKGPLKDKTKLEAQLRIPTLAISYQQLQLAAAEPITADYSHSVLTLQPAEIRGTGTSLRLQGTVPLTGSRAIDLTARGSIDARILRMFDSDLQSSGTVALDLRAAGSPSNPAAHGEIKLQDIALSTTDVPLGLEKLNGTLTLNNDRLQISTMTGQVGDGQVSLGGSIIFRPNVQFALALQGKSVRLLYPTGLRSVLDSNLSFSGNLQASSLNGRVLIDSLSFTPEFDLATFGNQFSSSTAIPAGPSFADTVKLGILVQSKENLSTSSSQVSIAGNVNVNVIGTASNPVVIGRTTLTSGELFYRSNRYQLERGVISFADPNQTNPDLNVAVTTIVEQYKLTINLRGKLDRLTASYVSDPPLSTVDIIHLIAFGNTTSEATANAAGQSTDSMLANGVLGAGVSSGIQKLAGISSIQVDPLLGGTNQDPGARIALQQRVTKNFLFTFSTDVSQPGQELVQGDYQINKRWSVTVTRDQVGGVSVDGRLHTKF